MSILSSDILTEAYQILGRPSQLDLPYLDLLVLVKDVARGRILDLKLSARDHTTQIGPWVVPSDREMSTSGFVGGLENFIPVKVEWRYLTSDGVVPAVMPFQAEVVAFDQLGDLSRKSMTETETFCAFYDQFDNIAFSEDSTTLSFREYRVLYEDTSDVTLAALSDSVQLPELFITLCKYESGLVALDQIRNADPEWAERRERLRQTFTAQFMIWDHRFKKFQTTLYGNKKVKKLGARYRL